MTPTRMALCILLGMLSACRSGDAKFDPWTDDEEGNWVSPSSDTQSDENDADGDGWIADYDCDEDDPAIHPGATEICDGIDNDCDEEIDEGVLLVLYVDGDGDGYGLDGSAIESCEALPGYEATGGDCDDERADVHPGAGEQCDDLDNDCDGDIDEDVLTEWYRDADSDGYGNAGLVSEGCDPPSGYVADDTDCDDDSGAVYPTADEWCDDVDNDCDGDIDEDALDSRDYYLDADGDGFGDADQDVESCDQPSGYVVDDEDCDDRDSGIHPDAVESCDGVDNDCDGDIDDGDSDVDGSIWYGDSDGDGYGGTSFTRIACEAPVNFVDNADDCDDLSDAIHPDATEICNETDDDCDGDIDDDDASLDASTGTIWYVDDDSDGFGDPDSEQQTCFVPGAAVSDDTDCDDSLASVNPDAEEKCDGLDNDCDGDIDTDFADTDEDGTADCVDPTVFSDDFDDSSWGDWDVVDFSGYGSSDWSMTGNTLMEDDGDALTIAIGPDLGSLESYTLTVDAWSGGYYNDAIGFVFAYQAEDDMMVLWWDDFNGFYGSYYPDGEVELWGYDGSWVYYDADDDSEECVMDYATWTEMSLTVDGRDIYFYVDGDLLFETTVDSSVDTTAGRTGVVSYDNDGGIYYDNYAVTQP